jgi:uncharacterized RDD family membrane protein YckC
MTAEMEEQVMEMGGAAAMSRTGVHAEYASVWIRFVALIIDGIVLNIISYVIAAILGESPAEFGVSTGLATIVSIVYYTVAVSRWGQTLGAKALGIKVVDANGGLLSVGGALVRSVGSIVSGLALGLGYFWALWDKNKQTWHDKFANSYVVKA